MTTRFRLYAFLGCALSLTCSLGFGHPADENPDLTLPETTKQFRQDRFGLFIHWGIYSTLADGETVMKDKKLSVADYEQVAGFFNPAEFDARQWVSLAKGAGMKYITFSARSDDGFAMWDSGVSDWNVAKRTPFKRDVVKELANECRRQNIKLFLSYSARNWREAGLFGEESEPVAVPGDNVANTTAPVSTTDAQIIELLTKYGKIDGVWFDGLSFRPQDEAARLQSYGLIRKLQPAALIGNNHSQAPLPGENFQIRYSLNSEQQPGESGDGLEYSSVPVEISQTVNDSLGYRITDHEFKSERELIHMLVRSAGSDANFLLNVGAMPNGQIQQDIANRLRRVGLWMAKNGDSIYGTRGGPMAPQPWGVMTHRRQKIYVHVMDPEVTSITLQLPTPIRTARYFSDESEVSYESVEGRITLTLRPEQRGEMERLLILETRLYDNAVGS